MMVFVLILVIGGGLVGRFLFTPLLDLKGEYREQSLQLDTVEQRTILKLELRTSLEEVGEDAAIIERSLLERGKQPLEFIEDVERIAFLTRNEYESRGIQKEDRAGAASVFRISFDLRGSFTDTVRFLRELNSLSALLNIRSVNMSSVGEEGTVQTSIVLEVFTY